MAGRLIYLVGSAGYPNYGDEAVAGAWLRHLARTEPEAEVWLDCPNPGAAQLYLGGLHPRVRFVDTVFRVSRGAADQAPEAIAAFAQEAARRPGFGVAHMAPGIELLHRADVYHLIGGSYVNSIWPTHLGALAAGATLQAEHGTRVAVTGLSLVPASGDAELLTRLTEGFAVTDLRDDASKDLVRHDTASVTGDDYLLAHGEENLDPRESPSTMLCLQSDLVDGDVDALATTVLETARAWGLRPDRVGYLEGIPGEDRAVFEKISAELPGMRFYPFTEVWREGLPARRGQRWITTRPSLHVAAAAAGAWGVAVPVKPGYDDVAHRDLVAKGSRWSIVEPGRTAAEAHGEAGFGRAVDGMVEAKRALAAEVYGR
jgi:hypothetical protein